MWGEKRIWWDGVTSVSACVLGGFGGMLGLEDAEGAPLLLLLLLLLLDGLLLLPVKTPKTNLKIVRKMIIIAIYRETRGM